jgi:hypothetical protein
MGINIMTAIAYNGSLPINDRSPSAGKVVVPLFLSFTAGTGGMMTYHSTEILNRWIDTPRIHVERSFASDRNIDTRSPAEHVANIRDVFEASMSDLAAVLGVSRPTAYTWLEGNEPKPDAITRIQRLSRIADRVKGMNIERMDKLIHRKILNGESLFDLLKTDRDPSIPIQSLKEISEKEARTRQESKSSGKHRRSLDEISSESGVPIV